MPATAHSTRAVSPGQSLLWVRLLLRFTDEETESQEREDPSKSWQSQDKNLTIVQAIMDPMGLRKFSRDFFLKCFKVTYFIRLSVMPAVGANTPILTVCSPYSQIHTLRP